MRKYGQVPSMIWTGETGRWLRSQGPEVQVLLCYLHTSPHANMIGLYYLPITTIMHETGLPEDAVTKALARLSKGGFAEYDVVSESVYVPGLADVDFDRRPLPKDNRCKGAYNQLFSLPPTRLKPLWLKRYAEFFRFAENEFDLSEITSPSQAPRSPSEAIDGDRDGDGEGDNTMGADAPALPPPKPDTAQKARRKPDPHAADIKTIFDHWRSATGRSRAKLNDTHKGHIRARLREGYTVDELIRATDSCVADPWHQGENDRGTPYLDIKHIYGSQERTERHLKRGNATKSSGKASGKAVLQEMYS